jgi:ribosomal protein S18 acetylase RimI-like enzyme
MVEIERVTDLDPLVPTLARIFTAAFNTTAYPVAEHELRHWTDSSLPLQREREGFKFLVARDDADVVGFIYGYAGAEGQYWEDWLRDNIPGTVYREWFGGHFGVTELSVLPEYHGQGIGSRLHDALLDDLPYERAVLTTYRGDTPAMRLYMRSGWSVLWDQVDERLSLLGRRLP